MGNSTSNPTGGYSAAVRDALWHSRHTDDSNTLVTFRKATQQELWNAWEQEEQSGTSPSLYLASRGLYDDTNTECLFHPSIVQFAIGRVLQNSTLQNDHNPHPCITMQRDTYTVTKKYLDKVINIFSSNPSGLYQ